MHVLHHANVLLTLIAWRVRMRLKLGADFRPLQVGGLLLVVLDVVAHHIKSLRRQGYAEYGVSLRRN